MIKILFYKQPYQRNLWLHDNKGIIPPAGAFSFDLLADESLNTILRYYRDLFLEGGNDFYVCTSKTQAVGWMIGHGVNKKIWKPEDFSIFYYSERNGMYMSSWIDKDGYFKNWEYGYFEPDFDELFHRLAHDQGLTRVTARVGYAHGQ